MGNCAEVFTGKTKQRVCDEQREFLGNYKTVVGKEEALQKAIWQDSEEGPVSGPFSESELRAKYHRVLLNSSGGLGIKDLTRPDVRTLAGATQGVDKQHIRPKMQPARPSLSDAVRITDRLKNRPMRNGAARPPATAPSRRSRNADSSRSWGESGLYYANAVGNFEVVSTGQNWGRLASAAIRRELKFVDAKEVMRYARALFLLIIFSNDSRIPFQREQVLGENELVWMEFPLGVDSENAEFPK